MLIGMPPRLIGARAIATLCLCATALTTAAAQMSGRPEILVRADSLSSSGEFAAVVTLLEAHVQGGSASSEAWLLLAQHAYWNGDTSGAHDAYAEALEQHPSSVRLRLAFAQFLLEVGHPKAALDILRSIGSENAEAERIRGTAKWWTGDLTAAARHFKKSLSVAPEQEDAAAALAAIRHDSRPWFRVATVHGTDTQPLSRTGTSAGAGLFVTPLQTVSAEAGHMRYAADDQIAPVSTASLVSRGYWPELKLESELSAGVVARGDSAAWTGAVVADVRVVDGIRIGASWDRKPYLYTLSSLSESIMTSTAQSRLVFDRKGWLGEAVAGLETFPDDNVKTLAYAWLMAPVLQSKLLTIQGGYAFSYQNTNEHRFTPVLSSAPRPGHDPEWEGRYDPYHTPIHTRTHSVSARLALHRAGPFNMQANGSYAVIGFEQAPYVYLVGRAPATDLYNHAIHPWNVEGSISASISPDLQLYLKGSHMATTWYEASTISLELYVRL